ncbi:MAG: autotransporter outer membrane beta-barrel domain-containing protein [Verrucomicrobia bacterium]|nr:MAG: autotransporter outer membrane beta-barrel domain-containing protein [Verrucomicrobiota bacterium]
MKTTLPTPTTLRRSRTFLANSIRALLFSAAAATSLLAATFDSPFSTWSVTPTGSQLGFDTAASPTFSTLSGVTGLTVNGTTGAWAFPNEGNRTLTIELFDPNTATWNSVHSVLLPNLETYFSYDGLSITFASQTASQIRLFSNDLDHGPSSFGYWFDEIFTLIYNPAPTVPLTLHLVDGGAIFSTLESGLPLAVAQRNLLLNALRTATRDVNGRLFALRAGLSLTEDAAGSAGSKGNDLMHRASDGKTVAAGKSSKTPVPVEEPFRHLVLFGSGDFGRFDQDSTATATGFDSDVWVGTVGAEYRFNRHFAVGLAASYINSDTDLGRNIGGVRTEGMAISVYGSAVWRDFYFDVLYSYGALDEEITRHTLVGSTATGDAENRSHTVDFNTGYTLHLGKLRTGPIAGVQWIHGDLDGYSERGGGSAALNLPGQNYDSLISQVGWQLSTTVPVKFGAITPQVRATWDHEYLNSADTVSAQLQQSPFASVTNGVVSLGNRFGASANTAAPGSDYLNLGAGVAAQFGERIAATLQYETHLFQEDATAHFASLTISVAF